MVFQSYAIWPHMTVFDNIVYPLKCKKVSNTLIKEKAKKVVRLLGLGGLEDRYGTQLSGGQQQRVALARSLIYEPKVLLLDEPLSNLDAKLRERTRFELKELQRKLGITMIYVTHDQLEAMALADTAVVMNNGKLMQIDKPISIYRNPKNTFVADFIGLANFFEGEITEIYESGVGKFQCEGDICLHIENVGTITVGQKAVASVRPEDFTISRKKPPSKVNVHKGRVMLSSYVGNFMNYRIEVGEKRIRIQDVSYPPYRMGEEVYIHVNPERCILLQE